jgi:phosphohistidine phosphatase
MDFFLVRHGEAKPEHENPRRPLTDQGRKDVERVARAAAAKKITVAEILHSDKLRAGETAEILARYLSPRTVRQIARLAPEDDPLIAKAELETADRPLMLVGHLPHLGRLASLLVTGNEEKKVVDFPAAAMACLSYSAGIWKVRWILAPEAA